MSELANPKTRRSLAKVAGTAMTGGSMTNTIEAVGHVRGGRADPIDDDWGQSRSAIEFGPGALAGLEAFSHAEIIFLFDKETRFRPRNGVWRVETHTFGDPLRCPLAMKMPQQCGHCAW